MHLESSQAQSHEPLVQRQTRSVRQRPEDAEPQERTPLPQLGAAAPSEQHSGSATASQASCALAR